MLILGLQIVLPAGSPPQDAALGLAARRTRPVTIAPVPEYAAILTSPLFAPDRHPGAADGAKDTGGGTLAGYAALGAVTGRRVATAVVSAPGGTVKSLKPGDDLEGWRLVGIDRLKLTFERNGMRRALVIGAPALAIAAADAAATKGDDQ